MVGLVKEPPRFGEWSASVTVPCQVSTREIGREAAAKCKTGQGSTWKSRARVRGERSWLVQVWVGGACGEVVRVRSSGGVGGSDLNKIREQLTN